MRDGCIDQVMSRCASWASVYCVGIGRLEISTQKKFLVLPGYEADGSICIAIFLVLEWDEASGMAGWPIR